MSTTAAADGLNPRAAVEGLGNQRCGAIINALKEDTRLVAGYAEWLSGFLTAANMYEPDTFDLTGWQTKHYFTSQVLQTCQNRPEAALSDVAVAYVGFLREQRLKTPSDMIVLRQQGSDIAQYEAILDRMKMRLKELGYDIQTDGAFGADVQVALKSFQADKGIAQSGLPDLTTLTLLFE
ncbi:peptidoglycan-binding domain-containing protein [Litoreibacter ponti]|uniref:peptidoglycan-binding domain-containing protein n=1 Tax=Litoreibacter ponti TaxID=1510457 RepID=UPI001304C477|nr:peptidoglycan-binding domain-containing protein [Litoreibacter ponti]